MSSAKLRVWVSEQIKEKKQGEMLPTDVQLAAEFSVSRRTVQRVLGNFRNAGTLVRIPGKGTFIGPDAEKLPKTKNLKPAETSAQSLFAELLKDISLGTYKIGQALPPIKTLSIRFKISPATVSTAYRMLVDAGIVVRVGKTAWVGTSVHQLTGENRRAEVIVLHHGNTEFAQMFQTDMLHAMYQTAEYELTRVGCVVRYESREYIHRLHKDLSKQSSILPRGIIWAGVESNNLRADIALLHRFLQRIPYRRPEIVVDFLGGEVGVFDQKINLISRSNILTVAVRTLAQFIIQKQYKHFTVLIDEHHPVWNHTPHIVSLAKMFAEFSYRLPHHRWDIKVAAKQGELCIQDYFEGKISAENIEALLNKYRQSSLVNLQKKITFLQSKTTFDLRQFDSGLIICNSAELAAYYLQQCQAKSIMVPKRISFLVLESEPRFFHLGISTCIPDFTGLGYVAAHAIIGDIPVKKSTKGYLQTTCSVVEKLTT